ncbi:hypothetical protein ILUMI_26108 [Ignelater luminosus]|uniref:Uncharacterized protein n=1 Tax=Ignelater luminosus TaxID=2038154 RepID=A0A8K0C685_IGNLU|nr:hypothetical protein ILUMI_26108 [Ignelater luminosus]
MQTRSKSFESNAVLFPLHGDFTANLTSKVDSDKLPEVQLAVSPQKSLIFHVMLRLVTVQFNCSKEFSNRFKGPTEVLERLRSERRSLIPGFSITTMRQCGKSVLDSLKFRHGPARLLSLPSDETKPERSPLWDGGKNGSVFDVMSEGDSRCKLPEGVRCMAEALVTVY